MNMYNCDNPIELSNSSSMDNPTEIDTFRKTFKYYKSRKPKPSLDQVLLNDDCDIKVIKHNLKLTPPPNHSTRIPGLRDFDQWEVNSFKDHPGLLLIRNPFTALGQRYWIRRCLEHYPIKPNKTNIDIDLNLQNWWAECHKNGECNQQLRKKMRWTTLGYHHNWDTKIYTDENCSEFPSELHELCSAVSDFLQYSTFKAEAAIVNYYHMDSTLSPHTDHSEVNLKAPLFSFSFGQSAIFLIGSTDKSIEPSAILLRSGDIVVMSEQARLCYHAVPKILPNPHSPWNDPNTLKPIEIEKVFEDKKYIYQNITLDMKRNIDDTEWSKFESYIAESRINMNVRQVLNENQVRLSDQLPGDS